MGPDQSCTAMVRVYSYHPCACILSGSLELWMQAGPCAHIFLSSSKMDVPMMTAC
jgi:hypothetical protein